MSVGVSDVLFSLSLFLSSCRSGRSSQPSTTPVPDTRPIPSPRGRDATLRPGLLLSTWAPNRRGPARQPPPPARTHPTAHAHTPGGRPRMTKATRKSIHPSTTQARRARGKKELKRRDADEATTRSSLALAGNPSAVTVTPPTSEKKSHSPHPSFEHKPLVSLALKLNYFTRQQSITSCD